MTMPSSFWYVSANVHMRCDFTLLQTSTLDVDTADIDITIWTMKGTNVSVSHQGVWSWKGFGILRIACMMSLFTDWRFRWGLAYIYHNIWTVCSIIKKRKQYENNHITQGTADPGRQTEGHLRGRTHILPLPSLVKQLSLSHTILADPLSTRPQIRIWVKIFGQGSVIALILSIDELLWPIFLAVTHFG